MKNPKTFAFGFLSMDILPSSQMNSNSHKMMHQLRRYDALRFAQYDVNSLRSFMMRSVP